MGRKERRFQARIAEARKKDFYKKKMDKENKKKKEEKKFEENIRTVFNPIINAWLSIILYFISIVMFVAGRFFKDFAFYVAGLCGVLYFVVMIWYLAASCKIKKKARTIRLSGSERNLVDLGGNLGIFTNIATMLGFMSLLTENDNSIVTRYIYYTIAGLLVIGFFVVHFNTRRSNKNN